jgi:hypothetical protein
MGYIKELDRVSDESHSYRIPQEYPIIVHEVVAKNRGPLFPVVLAKVSDEADYESLLGQLEEYDVEHLKEEVLPHYANLPSPFRLVALKVSDEVNNCREYA